MARHSCPFCREMFAILPERVGRAVRCPKCRMVSTVPGEPVGAESVTPQGRRTETDPAPPARRRASCPCCGSAAPPEVVKRVPPRKALLLCAATIFSCGLFAPALLFLFAMRESVFVCPDCGAARGQSLPTLFGRVRP